MRGLFAFVGVLIAAGELCAALKPMVPAEKLPDVKIYVSPAGKDSNPGTLAKPFNAGDTVLYVNERPADDHACDWGYCKGNALKIGHELLQYTGLSREKPYRFTGLKRGAFGTRPASHPSGARCDYLRQRYLAFYPDPDTPLVHELASCISNAYTRGGFDQIYLDGSEGSGTRYATDATRRTLFSAVDQSRGPVLVEASCQGPHNLPPLVAVLMWSIFVSLAWKWKMAFSLPRARITATASIPCQTRCERSRLAPISGPTALRSLRRLSVL